MNIINTHLLNKIHQKPSVLYNYILYYRAVRIKVLIVRYIKLLKSFITAIKIIYSLKKGLYVIDNF